MDPIKFGLYIIILIPGYIFVQIKEHHLLREKRSQFEKTLDIILLSAIIWMIVFIVPYFPLANDSILKMQKIIGAIDNNNFKNIYLSFVKERNALISIFIYTCLYTFLLANLYGYLRKSRKIDSFITYFTARDWYPSVAFRFYKENLNKAIEVKTKDNWYLGILNNAPDNKDDKYIIITEPYKINMKAKKKQKKLEKLEYVEYIIINIEDVEEIKAYNEEILGEKK